MESREQTDRLTRIYSRWNRARTYCPRTSLDAMTPLALRARFSGWVAFASSLLMIPFSQAIIPMSFQGKVPVAVTLLPFRPKALAALAVLGLLNAWLINGYLAHRTPREPSLHRWVRGLRFLASGIPLVGVYTTAIWHWAVTRYPKLIFNETTRGQDLGPLTAPPEPLISWFSVISARTIALSSRVNERFTTELGLGLLLVLNAVVVGVAIYSEVTEEPELRQRIVVAVIGVLFHVAAFLSAVIHFVHEARESGLSGFSYYVHLVPTIFWLVPFPYLALVASGVMAMVWLILGIDSTLKRTLVHRAYSSRGSVYLSPASTLEESIQQRWADYPWWQRLRRQPAATLPPAREHTESSSRIFALYRWKTLALTFDAMALGWIVRWIGAGRPGWSLWIDRRLETVVNVSIVLCVGGILVMAVYFARLAVRSLGRMAGLDQHPYAQYLCLTQLSFMIGIEVSRGLYRDDVNDVIRVLREFGYLGCVLLFLAYLMRAFLPGGERIEQSAKGLLGTLTFLAIAGLAQRAAADEAFSEWLVAWLRALAMTSLLWHVVAFLVSRDWLLRSFELERFPSVQSSKVQRAFRGILALTLTLPLGGLTIPLWIYARHRNIANEVN